MNPVNTRSTYRNFCNSTHLKLQKTNYAVCERKSGAFSEQENRGSRVSLRSIRTTYQISRTWKVFRSYSLRQNAHCNEQNDSTDDDSTDAEQQYRASRAILSGFYPWMHVGM